MNIHCDSIKHQREIIARIKQDQLLRLAMEEVAREAGVDLNAPGISVHAHLSAQGIGSLGPVTHDAVVEITMVLTP